MSQEDAAALLSEFIYQIDNLPSEVAFILEEIGWKDEKVQEARLRNLQREALIQKHIKQHGLLNVNPKEAPLIPKIRADQAKISKLSDEKVELAERAVTLLEKYVAKLDGEFTRLKDMGYNLGEAEAAQAAAQAAAAQAAQLAAASAAMPALDFGMNNNNNNMNMMNNNKKRLSGMGAGGGGVPGMQGNNKQIPNINTQFPQGMPSPGMPSSNGMGGGIMPSGFPPGSAGGPGNNPYAAGSIPFQGNNLSNSTYQAMQAGMNNGMFATIGQYNAALAAQQQAGGGQQFQGQPGQFPPGMQFMPGMPNAGNAGGGGGGQNANNRDPNRPNRPSRLSSSFSAAGGAGPPQILPSTAAAHLPPHMQAAAAGQSGGGGPAGNKRSRPSQGGGAGRAGGGTGGNASNKKKKRIIETDDESAADDASGQAEASEDVDAEGEDEDAEGEDDKSIMSAAPLPTFKKGQKNAHSRAGTPSGGAGGGNTNKNQQSKANAAASRKQGKKVEEEEEEIEADAEGEEDWGAEVDEANADDPTLYCFCHRVSYGNMIACDNPDCKYEWFHWACVRVTKQPDDDQKWYCPECRPRMPGQGGGNGTGNAGQGMGKGNINFQGGRVLGSAASGPYQQLQAQQQQMMMAAQQAREGSSGRASRRG